MIPQTSDHVLVVRVIAGVYCEQSIEYDCKVALVIDRAALAAGCQADCRQTGMSPASALRRRNKSAAKIKQLSVELRRQQTERDQRKPPMAGGRRQSNGGQATATAKALNTFGAQSKKGARSPEPVKPRKSVEPGSETPARSAVALQSDMMRHWLKLYVGW